MDNAEKFQKAVEAARRDTLAASASNSPKQRKWELVVKRRGVNGRKTPAVTRVKGGHKVAFLSLPVEYVAGPRADILSDGNGSLAFRLSDRGAFSVYRPNACSTISRVAIPASWAPRIPFGTTDVHLERDGDLLVLDLNAITPTT